MKILESILLAFSKEKLLEESCYTTILPDPDKSLSLLEKNFHEFGEMVKNKEVLDFGCGLGFQSIALVKKYDCSVTGFDTNEKTLHKAIKLSKYLKSRDKNLTFVSCPNTINSKKFDVVISQNSFEHFDKPKEALSFMGNLTKPSGSILISFGPPWYSPYGSHMNFFCKIPWLNILFPEKTVMSVRKNFRNDGANRYEEVESGLNKMTINKFKKIVSECDLLVEFEKYKCVKNLDFISLIPILNELFVNNVTIKLKKAI